MAPREGKPTDDAGLLRRSLDGMTSAGILTIDADNVIVQISGPGLTKAPSLLPGRPVREALEELTHEAMVDRLLIARKMATFAPQPGGPEFHWMLWGERSAQGELIITFWDTDWNEVNNQQRAAFTMAASHELRGPLTTLLGFAEILNMDPSSLSPEQAEAAAIVERTARHLAVLVDDVFDLSQNSFGELRLNLGQIDLGQTVRAVCASRQNVVAEREQTLDCYVGEDLPMIEADEARVTQMISNLVNNASVHNQAGTRIEVSVEAEEDRVAVAVADDGAGLPFANPEDAFLSFQRGDQATAGDRAGSGVGLAITRSLIQLHRGEITVETGPGEGTKFTLRFPVDRDSVFGPGTE